MTPNDPDRPGSTPENERSVLTSWKEIAAYLQVSAKTAQRYEQELGLPVKRLSGRVSISVADLQEWRDRLTEQPREEGDSEEAPRLPSAAPPPRMRMVAAAGIAAVCLAGAFLYWYSHRTGLPVSVHMEGSLLTVRDAKAQTVWIHQFETERFPAEQQRVLPAVLTDIDRDGAIETLLVWQHVRRDVGGWPLHCFSEDGKIRWVLEIKDEVRNAAGKEFGPPFVIRDFTMFDSPEGDGTRWTAAVFIHVTDDYSTLVLVDSAGKRRGQYWHVGHLNRVKMFDADGDGDLEIVAGGVRHGVEQAVLVAFDPARVSGTNPMPSGHPKALPEMAPSSEIRTGFLAKSKVSQQTMRFNFVADLQVSNGLLRVFVYETMRQPEGFLLYDFAPGLRVHDLTLSAAFEAAHRELTIVRKLADLIPEQEIAELKAGYRLEPEP